MKILKSIILGFLLVITMAFANAVSINQESQEIIEGDSLSFEGSGDNIIYYEWDLNNAIPEKTVDGRYIFYTSATHIGKFGNTEQEALANADEFCNNALRQAGLPGTCKAILSTQSKDAIDRIPDSSGGYYNIQGNKIADEKYFGVGKVGLVGGNYADSFKAGITDESGNVVLNNPVWTGSDRWLKSSEQYTCNSWTSDSETKHAHIGRIGYIKLIHIWDYIKFGTPYCSTEASLYGVQVDANPIKLYEGTKIRMKNVNNVQFNTPGEYTIDLRGYKEGSYEDTSIVITVLENQAPIVTVENQEIDESQTLTVPITAEDPEGEEMTYSVQTNIDGYEFGLRSSIGPEDAEALKYYLNDPAKYDEKFDYNNDGKIDVFDIGKILSIFGVYEGDVNYIPEYDLDKSVKSRVFLWQTGYEDEGNYEIKFTVTDARGKPTSKTITITVNNKNRLPNLVLISPENNAENVPLNAQLIWEEVIDPDGDDIEYEVYFGTALEPVSTQSTASYDPELDYEITYHWKIIMSDGTDSVESDVYKFKTAKENTAPRLSGIPAQSFNEDAGDLYDIIDLWDYAEDDETADSGLSFSITSQSNTGVVSCSVNSNRVISCSTKTNKNGYSAVTVQVSDGLLTASNTFRVTISSVNDVPIANILTLDKEIVVGETVDFQGQGSDIEGGVSYSWDFDNSNGIQAESVLQNPSHIFNTIGTFIVTLTVTDSESASAADTVTITVTDITGNHAPVISNIPDKRLEENSAAVDNAINLLDYASDADSDTLTFTLTQSNAALVNAVIDGNYVDISAPAADSTGTSEVCVIANDGSLDSNTACFDIRIGLDMLSIADLDIEVGSKTDTNVLDGEKISKEAKPGDIVELKFKIENKLTDLKIEDVEIQATLIGIDDGEDVEEESKEFDIRKSDDKKISLKLKVPYEVEEGNYNLDIHVEGQDEDGNTHEIDWTVTLVIEKDRHEVIIYKADLGSETLSCVRTTNLNIEILNIGQEDEDNVKLVVLSEELGIDYVKQGIELEEGLDDASYEKTIRIPVSGDVETGAYLISIKVYRDNELEDSQEISLNVEECEITEKEEKVGMEVITGKIIPTIKEIKEVENIGMIAALVGGIVVVLVLIVLALYLGFRKR